MVKIARIARLRDLAILIIIYKLIRLFIILSFTLIIDSIYIMDALLNTIDQVRIVLLRALIFKFIDFLRIAIETQVLRILSEVFGV